MRMRFGPDDEKAATSTRQALVERFAVWLNDHPEQHPAEPWDADLILSWKWGYGDGHYGRWTRADIDEVLLDHLPRKLTATQEEAAPIPASLGAFVHFLDSEGLLDRASDEADELALRAMAQQRAFMDAMADPSNFGMAKRLFTFGGFSEDDVPDQAALDEATARFNALSFDERGRILGLDDTGPTSAGRPPELPALPMRSFPSDADLAEAAGEAPLLGQVDALHTALGATGIKLTKAGNPMIADGRRLVEATGVGDSVDGIRSSIELRELFALGQVAQSAGAIEVSGGRLRATQGWTEVLLADRWQRVVDGVLDTGAATLQFGASTPTAWHLAEIADVGAFHFLAMLWLADEPVPMDVFAHMLDEISSADPALARLRALGDGAIHRTTCVARMEDVLTSLLDAGVVQLDGDDVTLTRAGTRLVAPWLAEMGFDVVTSERLGSLGPDDMLDLLAQRDDDPAVAAALWAGDRDQHAVAVELVAALVARPDPVRLLLGFALLERLGPGAVEAVSAARDTAIGPHAWLFLAAAGAVDESEVPVDLAMVAGIDVCLATAELGAPADVVEVFLGQVPPDAQPGFIDELVHSGHPRAGDLLELLGRHHPDRAIAKHARKAAHRWRSSTGGLGRHARR